MFNLMLWIAWLSILLVISYLAQPHIIFTPQFGFIFGFFVQAVYAVGFVEVWELNFSKLTMMVLFGGTATFLITSLLCQRIMPKFHRLNIRSKGKNQNKDVSSEIVVEKWKLMVFIIFQFVVLLSLVKFVSGFSGISLIERISEFRDIRRRDTNVELPGLLNSLRSFCIAANYIWTYLLIHSRIYKYKQHNILILINIILGLLCGFIYGGRGVAIALLCAVLIQVYYIHGDLYGWKAKIKFNNIIKVLLVIIAVVFLFQYSLRFLGRMSTLDFGYYLAVYLSAELKNLDIFIRKGVFGATMETHYTLAATISLIGKLFNIPSWIHSFNNPFRTINGYELGNVATAFYAPMHDGGLWGVLIYIFIMAIICSLIFQKTRATKNESGIKFSVLLYSYSYYNILFSFFSNKFYEGIICPGMIKTLVSWGLIIFFLNKVSIYK